MCGFLGQFGGKLTDGDVDRLHRLLYLSKSRGPDETKVFSNGEDLWMGFNRLAILDTTAAGSQPMHSSTARFTIVFNGEIYNHLELRKKLRFGAWRGTSDTETILACIEEWGFEKTVDQLDGMFAFAVFDKAEKTLLCARDFAGIKPFFFGWNGRSFVFASQYDQIARHPLFEGNAIDKQVLKLYLEQHFMPAPFGLLQQTGQLEPGQWCKVSRSGLKTGTFWRFPQYIEPTIRDRNVALEIIDTELAASVEAEMLSDVPLGAFLSGGIDSPLVCHYAARNSSSRLKSFTIGSDSAIHDETELAAQYARLIDTDHYAARMTADGALEMFDDVMRSVREPMADFSIIPTYLVSKLARKHVTVALSGDGGDELFFGYERFWSVGKNIAFQNLPWIVRAAAYKTDKFLTGNKNVNGAVLATDQATAHRSLHNRFSNTWVDRIFPDLRKVPTPPRYDCYDFTNTKNENVLIQSMRKAEFYGMMQKTLRKVDLASMAVSLEVRVPFLKKKFIESTLKLDPFLSYGRDKKKQLLKDHLSAMYPSAPIDNTKRGFSVPLGKWFNANGFRQRVEETLVQDSFCNRFGIDRTYIKEILADHSSHNDNKWPIFTLLALERQSRTDFPDGIYTRTSDAVNSE